MILRNLLRRKIRTLLTVLGISIGVAAILGMGALANGLDAGYSSMLAGSEADLVISQPNSFDISLSAVDEALGEQVGNMPEVSRISGMLQGFTQAEGEPYFFIFGYPLDSFVLDRFELVDGVGLTTREIQLARGEPVLLGSAAAEVLDKSVGDSLRLGSSLFRVVGIYQTGDAFEDSGALLPLANAQELLGRPRQVSVFYVQLNDPSLRQRFMDRVGRRFDNLSISGLEEFAGEQDMSAMLQAMVWVIGGLAIVLGGISMMNSQMMAVFERTREIGVLRALGWSSRRVLWMILEESILVCLAGGVLGVALGWISLYAIARQTVLMGADTGNLTPGLLLQAFSIVLIMGLAAGLYPAWRASRLQPVEALRYEGGSSGAKIHRLPLGGMATQSLWQRRTRTLLTLSVIGLTVGSIMALDSMMGGFTQDFSAVFMGADTEILIRQANVADTGYSAIDERVGDKIAAYPEVRNISGLLFTAVVQPDSGEYFILQGYNPNDFAIQRFKVTDGSPITSNHQILLGKLIAEAMNKEVGDTIDLSGMRFRVVGIFESQIGWEELGGVISLRDAQTYAGRQHKVTMFAVKLWEPSQAQTVVDRINAQFAEAHATISGEFIDQMPDFKAMDSMINGISLLAIIVGGLGVFNTLLMSVFERTREIGVLRALGWRRKAVLGLILREALLLGSLGGVAGVLIAFGMMGLFQATPLIGEFIQPIWGLEIFLRASVVAVTLGLLGGLYPAYRATRLQPVEALRYE